MYAVKDASYSRPDQQAKGEMFTILKASPTSDPW